MMNMVQACGAIAKNRNTKDLLVATMGSMFILDFIEGESGQAKYVPLVGGKVGLVMGIVAGKLMGKLKGVLGSAKAAGDAANVVAPRINSVPLMGGAAGLGLGLALAQPERHVTVVDGDASLLMELGGLVTVARQAPQKFLHVVIHNSTQFTGLDNMIAPAPGFDFAGAALNAGYVHAEKISDGAQWASRLPELQKMQGPVFVDLICAPPPKQTKDGFVQQELPANQFYRMGEEAVALQSWLVEREAA